MSTVWMPLFGTEESAAAWDVFSPLATMPLKPPLLSLRDSATAALTILPLGSTTAATDPGCAPPGSL